MAAGWRRFHRCSRCALRVRGHRGSGRLAACAQRSDGALLPSVPGGTPAATRPHGVRVLSLGDVPFVPARRAPQPGPRVTPFGTTAAAPLVFDGYMPTELVTRAGTVEVAQRFFTENGSQRRVCRPLGGTLRLSWVVRVHGQASFCWSLSRTRIPTYRRDSGRQSPGQTRTIHETHERREAPRRYRLSEIRHREPTSAPKPTQRPRASRPDTTTFNPSSF